MESAVTCPFANLYCAEPSRLVTSSSTSSLPGDATTVIPYPPLERRLNSSWQE